MNKKIILLLLCTFLNGLTWIVVVPIWHTPDEQSHFGQVAFMAEDDKQIPIGKNFDSNEEIRISEELLGTLRDNFGNNRFTFHPDYKIEYTDSYYGKYEASINALAKTNARKQFTFSESTRYPKLYYIPAVWLYRFFYNFDIFVRVYAVRFWSLILFIGTIIITYKLGQLFFNKKSSNLPLILALMVGCQPMMVFANIGVNSDALGNLLFAAFCYISCLIIISGANIINVLFLIINLFLALNTKPQFITVLPMFLVMFVILFLQRATKRNIVRLLGVFITVIVLLWILINVFFTQILEPINYFFQNTNIASLIKFSIEYTLPHTYKEVLPWYWGVYDWLGVTYPRYIHRIINRILIITLIGFFIWIIQQIRNRGWKKRENQAILYLIICNVIYFIGISLYDWVSWYTSSYQLGIQGRYFFPLISSHMLIVLIGWRFLFSFNQRLKDIMGKMLGVSMMLFNGYALYIISKTYYSLISLSTFMNQVSQYKPTYIKGNILLCIFLLYFFSSLFFALFLFLNRKR